MARSLVVPEAGKTLVRVASFSDKVLTLQSHLPVAQYHTVSGVSGSATPTEIGSSPSAPSEGQKLSSQVQMGFQRGRKGNFPH